MTTTAIVIVSGGLDSCTLLQQVLRDFHAPAVMGLSFNYGQRHAKELSYAEAFCAARGVEHQVVDLTSLTPLISTSALTGDTEVPEGHYADDNMKATVVPNRNSIMINIGAAVACARGAHMLGYGAHSGDHAVYPDCRPEFVKAVQQSILRGNEGFISAYFQIYAPFTHMTKTNIAYLAHNLGVKYEETWSCYNGSENHCGRCATCVERLEAIHDSGYSSFDKTVYEDDEYWKTVTSSAPSA